jgi:hypothetical protein
MSNDKLNGFEGLAEGMAPMPAALELDQEKYLPELAEFDLTEAQKREFLETLWSVMRTFVEAGFRVDGCGQVLGLAASAFTDSQDGVELGIPYSTSETPGKKA